MSIQRRDLFKETPVRLLKKGLTQSRKERKGSDCYEETLCGFCAFARNFWLFAVDLPVRLLQVACFIAEIAEGDHEKRCAVL
jgi:hypothetical protein